MAKFVTEDGKGGISGDKFIDNLRKYGYEYKNYEDIFIQPHPKHYEVPKMKQPPGCFNRERLLNTSMYDLLAHIQETLSLNNRCILELITNEQHPCIKTNDIILNRTRQFADTHMDKEFIENTPKIKMRVRIGEDEYDERLETDEEWHDRMCHMYMHQYHPTKLQIIKCEECLQAWLNSDKW